jgi:ATP-dependent Lhr-like helicase
VFDYVAAFLYEGDAPLAERKAQALTIDGNLLRELIGGGELRDLLDIEVLNEVEGELQQLAEGRKARDIDEIHDMLRRLGDLTIEEVAARSEVPVPALLEQLVTKGRIARVRIAGHERLIAAEDAARYRDGLGIVIPPGLPAALLERAESPIESLIARWARTHAPFVAEHIAARWGIPAPQIEPVLALLEARGQLVRGELRPDGVGLDSCDPEVLRQLRRRTLAKLRAQVAPVGSPAYAAFLPRWHGLDQPRRGPLALRDAIGRLEGVALSFTELEQRILPARILDYHPRMLDELGASGELTWVGAGSLGTKDGRVMLLRRDRARDLAPEPQEIPNRAPVHDAIIEHLRASGASFLVAIEGAVRALADRQTITAALWDLVWAGIITNDTFAPLRSLAAPTSRRMNVHASFGGRWSLVESLGPVPTATTRAHAMATSLLERWGVASRVAAKSDELPGGFATVGDVLRAMEDAGTVRRGYFVEHLEGAQFAWPGAIDRLRETPRGQAQRVDVLAAVDPANAWGTALPWPQLRDANAHPARRVGGTVVLVDGALALWVEPKGKRIATAANLPAEQIELAFSVALPRIAMKSRRRELLVETVDGEAAGQSPWARGLLAAGARIDYRGLVVTGAVIPMPPPEPVESHEDDEREEEDA